MTHHDDIEPLQKKFFIWAKYNTKSSKRVDCPVCRHRSKELGLNTTFVKVPKAPVINGCEMVICTHCGFITYDPMFENIEQFHRERDTIIGTPEHRMMIKNKLYFENMAIKMLGEEIFKKRVLDYGCGMGELGALFDDYTGYEPNNCTSAYNRLINEYNISQDETIIKGQYDLVILNQVLDLVQDPRETLEKLRDNVTEDGTLLIVLDTLSDINYSTLFPTNKDTNAFLNDERYSVFTKELLISFVESIGFTCSSSMYTEKGRYFLFQKSEAKELKFFFEDTKNLFKSIFDTQILKIKMDDATNTDPIQATAIGKNALKLFSNWPDLILKTSNLVDLLDGEDLLEEHLIKHPEYSQLRIHVALKYIQDEEWETALKHLEDYLECNPNSEKTVIHLCHTYTRTERLDDLLKLLQNYAQMFLDIGQAEALGQLLKQL